MNEGSWFGSSHHKLLQPKPAEHRVTFFVDDVFIAWLPWLEKAAPPLLAQDSVLSRVLGVWQAQIVLSWHHAWRLVAAPKCVLLQHGTCIRHCSCLKSSHELSCTRPHFCEHPTAVMLGVHVLSAYQGCFPRWQQLTTDPTASVQTARHFPLSLPCHSAFVPRALQWHLVAMLIAPALQTQPCAGALHTHLPSVLALPDE